MVGESVAEAYGRRWSAGAAVRAEHFAALSRPAWEAVLAAVGVGEGTTLLDVACGSGELAALASARGAAVHGIDAAEAMIALARTAVPGADLRVGTLEALPWPDAAFDVVTGFNAFQFAPDVVAALAEAARVTRPGGRVAVCNWGGAGPQDLVTVTHDLQALAPDAALVPRRPIGEPGVLEELLRAAGLRPSAAGRGRGALRAAGPAHARTRHVRGGQPAPRRAAPGPGGRRRRAGHAAAPFRRADGSYLFHSTFRWVVARRD